MDAPSLTNLRPPLGKACKYWILAAETVLLCLLALTLLYVADVPIKVFATTAIGAELSSAAADGELNEPTPTSSAIGLQTDGAAPAVAISSPANGAVVSGAVVPITANASDDVGVAGVQFLLDGTSLGPEDTAAPYAMSWDTTQTPNGPHVLTAIARDDAGNQTTSSAISVTVQNMFVTDFLDMESGTVGAVVTTQLAAGATHGTSGTWTEGPYYAGSVPHQLKVAEIPPRPPRASVQVGTTVYPDVGSRGYVKKTTRETDAEFLKYVFAAPKPLKVSVGFFMYFSGAEDGWRGDTWRYYDVFVLEGVGGINYHSFNVQTSGGNDGTPLLFTNHTDDGCSGGLEILQARVDRWYWVTMLYDYSGTNRSATMEIYDPDAWQRIGRGVCNLPVVPANQRGLDAVAVGQYDDHANPTTNSYYYTDDLLIDATGSTFPLVPIVSADREAPTVAVTAPAAGSTVSGAVTLSADASDNVAVTQVQLQLDGAAFGSPLTAPPFSTVWNATASLGPHTLTAAAQDAAGNVSVSSPVTFEVVAAPPDPTPPVISDIATSNITSSDVHISWATDELSDGRVTVCSNGSDCSFQVDSHLVTAHVFDIGLLVPDTTYTYVVTSTDPAGNSATSAEQTFTTLADTTAPVVSLTNPVNGAIVIGADVTIAATVTDQSSIAGVRFKLDGQDLGVEDTTLPYTISWNTLQTSNGVHTLSASARDAVGNVGVSVITVTVNNDYTAPLVSLTSPANNATVSGTVTVAANATDNVGVTGVQFKLDGNNLGIEDSVAPFSIAWGTTTASNGVHVLTAVARDAAGNATTSAPRTVTVSNASIAPTISNILDQTVNEDTVMGPINFTVGDADTPVGNLTLTGTSSNPTRVPNSNIVFGGNGASRTVTVTPAANQNGAATITVTVSDGSKTATDTFRLTVNAVNDAPTISDIADRTITAGTSTGALPFTIGDVETPAISLTATRASSNTTLIPLANVVLGGSGANRTVKVTPAANQSGTATITVTVNDGTASTGDTFVLTVTANTAPTISDIADRTMNEDTSTGPIPFAIGDAETAAGSLIVTRASSNTTVVPLANVVLGGTGASRTVTVTPAANKSGTATITVTASDGLLTVSDTFVVTITPVNDAPTISNIADRTINVNSSTGAIAFTVGDVETAAGNLTLTGASSNATLVPNGNIAFGGSGANRTVKVTPAANQTGTATITVTVNDGTASASDTFVLTVPSPNTAPTVSNIADQTTSEDTSTGAIAFTIGDAETAAGSLTVTRASSNTTLVPLANVVLGGSGANRTVTVTPEANQSGTATITVTVSDGALTASDTFVVAVNPINDPPAITDIASQSIVQNTSTSALGFTLADLETAAASLTVTGTSSDQTLVPDAAIAFGGSDSNRTVTVTPAANQTGTATITVTVSDGSLTSSDTFVLTVTDG